MYKILIVLFVALLMEAIGVVFLSKGLHEIGEVQQINVREILGIIGRGACNRNIILGIFFDALFFFGLLYMMSQSDVSFVWPMTSLGFLFTTFSAWLILKEEVVPLRWFGIVLIVIGALLVGWTENQSKEKVLKGKEANLMKQVETMQQVTSAENKDI